MNRLTLALAATLLAGTAMAQTTAPTTAPGTATRPMTGTSPSTGVAPGTGVVDRNTGTAAAAGDRNQAVATTGANAPQPARGANSFTQNEARRRLERNGFTGVNGLRKDDAGVWRGTATKNGQQGAVWLDYKGNAGTGDTMAAAPTPATSTNRTMPGTTDGTPGNPPGTAAGRAMDRTLGTNTTGTNPAGSSATTPR